MSFWMGVASAQHALGGRDGGFAQLGHGKHLGIVMRGPKRRLEEEDMRRVADAMGVLTAFDDREA